MANSRSTRAPPGPHHALAQIGRTEHTRDRVGEGTGVVERYDLSAAVTKELCDSSCVCADRRDVVGEGLDQEDGQSFTVGGKDGSVDLPGGKPLEQHGARDGALETNAAVNSKPGERAP